MTEIENILRSYLRPYQRRLLEDKSRRIIVLKARQIGMSEAVCLLALIQALSRRRHDVYLASMSLRDAKDLVRRTATWLEIIASAGYRIDAKVTATCITLPNGSRIQALPAAKIRGKTGTIVLDEFAFYLHDREVWAAISPAAEARKDLRIILISTPFGASGVFHDIWTDTEGIYGDWSRHEIDVYKAAAEGFPVDPDALRARYPRDIWEQEFCCRFLSDILNYFPHDLIRRSLYDPDDTTVSGQWYAGVDLASSHDASVLAPLVTQGESRWIRPTIALKPAGVQLDYSAQKEAAVDHLRAESYVRVAVDGVGEGKALYQDLRAEFGNSVVGIVSASDWRTVYEDVPRMKQALEDGHLWVPSTDRALITALGKVERHESTNKTVKYEAKRDSSGHGDEFTAALLAFHVSASARQPLQLSSLRPTTTVTVHQSPC